MLKLLAMRATTAALNYGCKTGSAAHQAAARTVAHPRAMFGTCWASPGPAGLHMTQGGQRSSPTLPALRAYSYEAVATDAAQIVEVDYDPAAANSGGPALPVAAHGDHSQHSSACKSQCLPLLADSRLAPIRPQCA